ncbi:MAG TPA: ABC transporter [Firmicutes bacterium]|nr:ABC transporter [Bacillota bacterium]
MSKNAKLLSIIVVVLVGLVALAAIVKPEAKSVGEDVETVVVTHTLGETTIEKNPETVLVFDLGVLDALDYLEVPVAGVPKSSLPTYLEQYNTDEVVNVGGIKEPDLEAIYAAQPDLIIISGRQADYYEDLSEIAPTLYVTIDNNNYLESFKENMTLLGEIFEKEDAVAAELEKVETQVLAVKEKVEALNQNALIVLSNEGEISAYGAESRFGIIHNSLGFAAADDTIEVSTHGQKVSFEYVADVNPDYLFVVDRSAVVSGSAEAEATLNNELIQSTDAYKNDQIVYLDAVVWYTVSGGFTSTMKMVEEIETAISK